MDLVSSIGESVALGAAGVIFWGDTSYANSKVSAWPSLLVLLDSCSVALVDISSFSFQANCTIINNYLQGPLGRYLLNVSTAAEECSQALCKSHGRCLRRHPDTDVYLHLSPSTHSITSQDGQLKVTGEAGKAELSLFRTHFQCQCYSGYLGEACAQKENGQNRASSVIETWPLCFLLPLVFLTLVHWGNCKSYSLLLHRKRQLRLTDLKSVQVVDHWLYWSLNSSSSRSYSEQVSQYACDTSTQIWQAGMGDFKLQHYLQEPRPPI